MELSANAILWLTFAASLVPVLLAYLAVLYLRRGLSAQGRSPQPSRTVLSAGFVLGGLGGMVFGIGLGPWFPSSDWLQTAVFGPLLEEVGKGLLPLLLFAVGRMPDRASGIAVGLVVGAGFAAIENLVFTIHGFAVGGEPGWESVVYIRLVFGTLIHMTASGLAGAVLGTYAGEQRLLARVVAPFSAIAVAWLIHGGWNSGIALAPAGPAWALLALFVAIVGGTALGWLYATELRAAPNASNDPNASQR